MRVGWFWSKYLLGLIILIAGYYILSFKFIKGLGYNCRPQIAFKTKEVYHIDKEGRTSNFWWYHNIQGLGLGKNNLLLKINKGVAEISTRDTVD